MKFLSKSTFLLCLSLGFLVSESGAGTISLHLTSTVDLSDEFIKVKLKLHNRGDETAQEVQPLLWIGNTPKRIHGTSQLQPLDTLSTGYEAKQHPFENPGTYHLRLRVEYRDALGSKFLLPYIVRFVHQDESSSGLEWEVEEAVLPKDEFVVVTLKNKDSWAKQIHFQSHTAMNIGITLPANPVELKGQESRSWHLKLRHGNLWPNTYVSYLIAHYTHEGIHYSSPVNLPMRVLPESVAISWWFSRQSMTITLIVLIGIAFSGRYGPSIYRKVWQKHS